MVGINRGYASDATWQSVSGARCVGGGNEGAVLGGKQWRRGENYARIRHTCMKYSPDAKDARRLHAAAVFGENSTGSSVYV